MATRRRWIELLTTSACLVVGLWHSAASAQATATVREEARARFSKGLELFEERRHEAALAEFQRAYDLLPSPAVLYNLGKVHALLGQAVSAADAYRRYLEMGGATISAARKSEVESELERLDSRIGRVMVKANVEPADVTVNNVQVAIAPMDRPLFLDSGTHTLGVQATGHHAQQRTIQVAGKTEQVVVFELVRVDSSKASVVIESELDGVGVWVDGMPRGSTPFATSISLDPGRHLIIGKRAGYQEFRRELALEADGTARVALVMARDPAAGAAALGMLRLHLPEAAYALELDGESLKLYGGELTVPVGPHELELVVAERQRFTAEIDIAAGRTLTMSPRLKWTPDARQERLDTALARRTAGLVIAASGVAVGAVGFGLYWVKDNEQAALDQELAELNARFNSPECQMSEASLCYDPVSAELVAKGQERDSASALRTAGLVGTAVGIAGVLAGAAIMVFSKSPAAVDDEASAQVSGFVGVRVGGAEAGLAGRF